VLARTKSTLLITGESGVGKDYIARYIHEQSSRSAAPYFSVNCAALPPPLAESELFGHVSGAFTGAWRLKRGLLEIAEGGTLLLNEIGELSLPLQAKLLTFLDTKSFTRVGGTEAVNVNVRVIAATNRDLPLEVEQSRFRADLFYRLNVMTLRVPPLRERKQDLPLLVNDLLGHIAAEMELETLPHPSPATLEAIMSGLVASGGRRLDLSDMGLVDPQDRDWLVSLRLPGGTSFQEALREMKRQILEEALLRSSGRIQDAARLLKMSRYSFSRQMQRAKPDPPDSSAE
jgi:transcriptional regulator with GAF, ATPase, and Fis domain